MFETEQGQGIPLFLEVLVKGSSGQWLHTGEFEA